MATLTATDNGDGTGATATVSGGAADADNQFFAFKLNGAGGAWAGQLVTSSVGNGPAALGLSVGIWFVYLLSDGVFSGGYQLAVTDGTLPVATRCRRAISETLRLLTIPPAARVFEQCFPDASDVKFPCILTSVDGVQETEESALSTRDDIGRPVKVAFYDRHDKREHAKLTQYEGWRQAAMRCFINQQLIGVPESKICRIEPYVILDPNLPQFEFMVSGFLVRCICREPRGVGV